MELALGKILTLLPEKLEITTSCVVNPTALITSVCPMLPVTENLPASSVDVPALVCLTNTEAFGTGAPASLVTVPVTSPVWAKADWHTINWINKHPINNKDRLTLILVLPTQVCPFCVGEKKENFIK